MKVLVADDEPEIREMLGEYLTLHGFEVVEAGNGLEALLQVKHGRPGAIVLDLRMPRLGGIEALKRIRAFDPTITVVVLTAETERDVLTRARAFGARAVLGKPVDLSKLLRALRGEVEEAEPSPPAIGGATDGAVSTTAAAGVTAHVMVVDDDAAMRDTLAEFLTHRGYRVSAVSDGATAIRAILEAPPDVVLLDIDMPGLKGTDALPTIRAVAPAAAVIMVSGTRDEDVAKSALAHGAFDYVMKPVDFNYLTQSLETLRTLKSLEP
jgi:CheY-like chemotaxis protein